jgi:hypothetical protein
MARGRTRWTTREEDLGAGTSRNGENITGTVLRTATEHGVVRVREAGTGAHRLPMADGLQARVPNTGTCNRGPRPKAHLDNPETR